MPLSSTFRTRIAEEIGKALSMPQLQDVVFAATGDDLFVKFASPDDPRARAVSRTLEQLEKEGAERWLLTYVLISALTNEGLRKLIVKACPETLVSLPDVDQQVERVLQNLQQVMTAVLTPEFRRGLKPSRDKISAVAQQICTLFVYKSLHECLHVLHLKLILKSALDAGIDDQTRLKTLTESQQEIERACAKARDAAALLDTGSEAKLELAWIAEMEKLAADFAAAVGRSDAEGAETLFPAVLRATRLQLPRLNKNIFESASVLSLDQLIRVLPLEITIENAFIAFSHSIRDLKPTVLARALVHKLWQDADNEISLLEDFLGVAVSDTSDFCEHWERLRSRILWLAELDKNDEWSKQAAQYSEHIDFGLMDEKKLDDETRTLLETYCRLLRFRFLAVDAMLKSACGSLRKIDSPLKSMLEEIS
jgi:hypothetical protein